MRVCAQLMSYIVAAARHSGGKAQQCYSSQY
jgi:hypothetical protein